MAAVSGMSLSKGLEESGPVFDRARRLARALFGDVEASVVLVGDGEAWHSHDPGGVALKDAPATSRVVENGRLLWVEDASHDPRFSDRPTVTGPVYDRCLAGESMQADRVEYPRPDGSMIWLQVELTPWRDGAVEIGGLIIASHDVTGMVEALERTERSEERLRLAMEIADVHVWELDYRRRELIKVGAEDTFFSEPKTYEELFRDIYSTVDPRDVALVQEAW